MALYFLGVFTPLEVIDGYFGGMNITNLLQSVFALLAFFFFNDSVRTFAKIRQTGFSYYIPLYIIPVVIVCFSLIQNKAPTAADFIVPRMEQNATAAYSGLYMLSLLLTDLRIIYMLRNKAKGIYTTFLAGLVVVAIACSCHLAYVLLFRFSPWQEVALAIGAWYDHLFYAGLSVTALGWLALFLSRRLSQVRYWLVDAVWLAALRLRFRSDKSRLQPVWDLVNETLENGTYKSVISLRNYEKAYSAGFPPGVEDRILGIERKLSKV